MMLTDVRQIASLSLLLCLVLLGVMALPPNSATARPLTIATGVSYPLVSSHTKQGFLDSLAKEAFQRAGIDVLVDVLPPKRVLVSANQGAVDGCLLRIEGLEKYYPNLVPIPETTINSQFVAYTTSYTHPITTWDDLNGLSVAYINGWKIFENNIKNSNMVDKLRDPLQMFKMLNRGRINVALYERWQGLHVSQMVGVENLKVHMPPLVEMKMFMYLHKKHQHLAPKVAAALKEIKADGTYQKLYDQILKPLHLD
ncbi:MAG: transporter substrate-binding domain-containing protein [Alphaproteobacteria bacterium]|nr:transporter substrate-binding domain-containing protein [Rhodospirillales bacterium]MCW9045686.1 transporter substrate-binding domain-containing protein [Alphaproteobacteria bacterium]